MGLTTTEAGLFLAGAVLIFHFLAATAFPRARREIASAANRHSEQLREEFIQMPAARIVSAGLLAALLFFSVSLPVTRSVPVSAFFGLVPAGCAGLVVRRYRERRRKRVLSQIPAFLDLLSGHVRAGHSLAESLAETVPLLPGGIREEMLWVLQQTRLGTPLSEAFQNWEDRLQADEVSLLVRPLRAALPGGGNIVDLLERTRDILRLRARAVEKLRSMTAQARLQAVVLTLLPAGFAFALSKVDPGFFPNLLGTPQGKGILVIALVLDLLGWITIRKILSVRP